MVEHLTFNQRVAGSNPARLTFAGVAELADAPDLGSGAARRGGSSPFTRTYYKICGSSSVVEHHLAKVGVAGSNPVFRLFSKVPICRGGGTGRRTGLKILRIVISVPVRFRSSALFLYAPIAQLDRVLDYESSG